MPLKWLKFGLTDDSSRFARPNACAVALAFRMCLVLTSGPSALASNSESPYQHLVSILMVTHWDYIRAFVRSSLSPMPQHLTIHFVRAVSSLRKYCGPDTSLSDLALLDEAEKLIGTMKGLPARHLDNRTQRLQVEEDQAAASDQELGAAM